MRPCSDCGFTGKGTLRGMLMHLRRSHADTFTDTALETFTIRSNERSCWGWEGETSDEGLPVLRRSRGAESVVTIITGSAESRNKCGNSRCVNPEHWRG